MRRPAHVAQTRGSQAHPRVDLHPTCREGAPAESVDGEALGDRWQRTLVRPQLAGGATVISVRLLGPVEVDANGDGVALSRTLERALLARLALHPGQPVSSERLIDDLWGHHAPRDGAASLQGLVYRLRRTLGTERRCIIRADNGYSLDAGVGVDVTTFDQLVARARATQGTARAEEAPTLLREALGLWRGPPLAGLESLPFVSTQATRLNAATGRGTRRSGRRRPGGRQPPRGHRRARDVRGGTSFRRAVLGAADAGIVPRRVASRCVALLLTTAEPAQRRTRHRAGPGRGRARTGHPHPGPRAGLAVADRTRRSDRCCAVAAVAPSQRRRRQHRSRASRRARTRRDRELGPLVGATGQRSRFRRTAPGARGRAAPRAGEPSRANSSWSSSPASPASARRD